MRLKCLVRYARYARGVCADHDTCGFAIGLERWTGRLTGAENIREVNLFPRDLHRLTP